MVKRLLSRTILNSNTTELKPKIKPFGTIQSNKLHTNEVPVKEIQIPVNWGHIAGKLWGSSQDRPILALHGWQDNAGTWDTLAPMLCKNRSILALDFPGHGLSSWIAPGMSYYSWELPRHILYIKDYFKWDKVSLLAHSMGSIAAFRYACLYPDTVDFYVALENLIYEETFTIDRYPKALKQGLISQTWLDKEPPTYKLEEMAKIWHLGTKKSVAMESAPHLLKRGSKQSKIDPSKYYFARDPRLKYTMFSPESRKFLEALGMRLACPTIYIKASDSTYAVDEFSVQLRELAEKNNKKFESHLLTGTHHIHLNNPEIIAPLITQFLQKHNIAI